MTVNAEVAVVAAAVVKEDQRLAGAADRAESAASSAAEQRRAAYADLNRFRWEMTKCEHGPRYKQREYAAAVGFAHATIGAGARAWQAVLEADELDGGHPDHPSWCAFGGKPHHQKGEQKAPKAEPVTADQAEQHADERRKLNLGEIRAMVVVFIARHFKIGESTAERTRRAETKEAMARLTARHEIDALTPEQIEDAINAIALEIQREDKRNRRRLDQVRRWMAENRGVTAGDVKVAEVRAKMRSIGDAVDRKGISWDEAAREARDWDRKNREADRERNEFDRRARKAVLELQQSLAATRLAARRVTVAIRAIETDSIPLHDDERDNAVGDIDLATNALALARAALAGDSGTDWDAALQSLAKDGES